MEYKGYEVKLEEATSFFGGTITSPVGLVYRASSKFGIVYSGISMKDAFDLACEQIDKKLNG